MFTSARWTNSSANGIYGSNMREMDDAVGYVRAALDLAGVTDNTIVFFTSDHVSLGIRCIIQICTLVRRAYSILPCRDPISSFALKAAMPEPCGVVRHTHPGKAACVCPESSPGLARSRSVKENEGRKYRWRQHNEERKVCSYTHW